MKHLLRTSFVFLLIILVSSCSKDDITPPVEGLWVLTEYKVKGEGIDVNKDGIISQNMYDELNCTATSKHTMHFEDGYIGYFVASPSSVKIALVEGTTNEYIYDVWCDPDNGTIGTTLHYSQKGDIIIIDGNSSRNYTINDDKLIGAATINIYDESFTNIIDTKALRVVYTKV
ncbi:hypothetical protein [Seonamhaeicola sp.]|uniref:hypothetical protein n=1 Tax=Seonamhaeicola sp. TaxID=1912245 RepID=UPI00262E3AC6|nr:hypothetical protein [Seonamhaeicola sp.]